MPKMSRRIAMKILEKILENNDVPRDGESLNLRMYGISVLLHIRSEYHDYAGRDYWAYHLIVRKRNQIVLDIEIHEWRDSKERFINKVNKYISRGWEWRIARAA